MKKPDHNRGSFFEKHCAKIWRKENMKNGINADDWWEQNKHRDVGEERLQKLAIVNLVLLIITAVFSIARHFKWFL